MKKVLIWGGVVFAVLAVVGALSKSATPASHGTTQSAGRTDVYTKSGNCNGASVSTLRFAPEPTAQLFPEAIWFEECPNGKFFMRIGEQNWKEISKKEADTGASMLKAAGRSVVRVVD